MIIERKIKSLTLNLVFIRTVPEGLRVTLDKFWNGKGKGAFPPKQEIDSLPITESMHSA